MPDSFKLADQLRFLPELDVGVSPGLLLLVVGVGVAISMISIVYAHANKVERVKQR